MMKGRTGLDSPCSGAGGENQRLKLFSPKLHNRSYATSIPFEKLFATQGTARTIERNPYVLHTF